MPFTHLLVGLGPAPAAPEWGMAVSVLAEGFPPWRRLGLAVGRSSWEEGHGHRSPLQAAVVEEGAQALLGSCLLP